MLNRSIAPSVNEFTKLTIPKPETRILDNGIRLVILNQGDDEVNNILLLWENGICESENPSVLKLLTATLNEATENRSGEEIASELEFNGSWLSVKAHDHHTSVSLHSLNSRLPYVLPVLTDIITNPTFPEDIIEVKRRKLQSTLELNLQKVGFVASTMIKQQIYGVSHPLAKNDTADSIKSVTRNDILGLHRSIIMSIPPTVFISGKIDGNTEKLITAAMESLEFDKKSISPLIIKPIKPNFSTRDTITPMPDKLQTAVNIAIPAIPRQHPDYDMLRIAVTALGGYFGSRLMANIREEKGYTYGISSGLLGTHEGAYIGISCECANEYARPVIEEVKKEIYRLADELMDDDELTTVRRYLQSSLASTLDNPFNIIDYYVKEQIVGIPDGYFYRQQTALMEATPEKIRHMAQHYMNTDNMFTSLAGTV